MRFSEYDTLLAGCASSACMKLLNQEPGRSQLLLEKKKEVVICKVQQAIMKAIGKSDAFIVPMK
jgi:hypothetical protein